MSIFFKPRARSFRMNLRRMGSVASWLFGVAHRVAAVSDVAGAAGRAATVLGVLPDGEDRRAVAVVGADVLVAANAEGVIQQAGGHADLPVWSPLTQLQVESACPRYSSPPRASSG